MVADGVTHAVAERAVGCHPDVGGAEYPVNPGIRGWGAVRRAGVASSSARCGKHPSGGQRAEGVAAVVEVAGEERGEGVALAQAPNEVGLENFGAGPT